MDQSQPARHGARAWQARVLRDLPRDRQRSATRARLPRESRLCVSRRSWHVAPRSCAKGDRPLTGVVPFCSARIDRNQRGTACARCKRACFIISRETASTVARSRLSRESRLRVVGGRTTSHHGLAPTERGLPPVQCPFMARGPISTSAARRARAASAHAPSPPKGQAAQWHARALATRKPAVCCTPQLAYYTTVLRERRQASHRCRALL